MAEAKVSPTLEAFLMCERVEKFLDGKRSLIGVTDGMAWVVETPPGEARPQNVRITPTVTLYIRWTNGTGNFLCWIETERPNGETIAQPEESFFLRDRDSAFDFDIAVKIAVTESGVHKFRLFLDGHMVAEKRVKVNLTFRRAKS